MRKRLLILAAIALLAIPLAWLLRDFVRDVFLVELGRVIWAARILFESLPQVLVWAGLVVALFVVAVRALRPRSHTLPDEAPGPAVPQGRVQMLSRWIDRSAKSEYFRQSLAHHLVGLACEVMAHREHTSPERLEERLRRGEVALPPLVGETLQLGQLPAMPSPTGFFSRLWQRLAPGGRRPAPDRGSRPGGSPGSSLDPALESLIEFLEDQLEIPSDPFAAPWEGSRPRGQSEAGPGREERQRPVEI